MAFTIDSAHSQITFSVRHMMISKVRGTFEDFDGHVELDEHNPARSTVEVTIDAASINTRDQDRDTHMRSADFLNVEEFPHIHFKSTRVEVEGPRSARLIGDLTIRGVTREVTIDVEYNGSAVSPWGTTSHGFSGSTVINRNFWKLTWNKALETGGVLVGDEINIEIELELVQQEEEAEILAEKEAESLEREGARR